MLRRASVLGLALGIALGVPAAASAAHLPPPLAVACPVADGVIAADWDDVEHAKKYSVNVIAGYDTADGDGVADVTLDFDFGTADRTDGLPPSQSDLAIPLAALAVSFDTDADGTPDVTLDPTSIELRVKSLHPGRHQGPQNGAFSAVCTVVP